ncbi:GtrA family protein [Faecalicatena contorta]|nr:GtrA family protein [Faecalicatena contorta]
MKNHRRKEFYMTNNQMFLKFLMVGIVNTILGTAVMLGLYNLGHCSYWFSTAANYILGSVLSYFLNKSFTFKDKQNGWKPIVKFVLNIFVCYIVAYGIAKPVMLHFLSCYSKVVQENGAMLFGICIFTGLNYLGQRLFVFMSDDKLSEQKK